MNWLGLIYASSVVAWAMLTGFDEETRPERAAAESIRDIIAAVIWTLYMVRSNRVKATFQRRAKRNMLAPGDESSSSAPGIA